MQEIEIGQDTGLIVCPAQCGNQDVDLNGFCWKLDNQWFIVGCGNCGVVFEAKELDNNNAFTITEIRRQPLEIELLNFAKWSISQRIKNSNQLLYDDSKEAIKLYLQEKQQ